MTDTDITPTLEAKSDQMNACDIMDPIHVVVRDIKVLGKKEDQPVWLYVEGWNDDWKRRPFKPCKTVRRLLAKLWGTDAAKWVGREMILYNDGSVKWAGTEVGGIRVSHLSHINRSIDVALTETRGQFKKWHVDPIPTDRMRFRTRTEPPPEADLDQVLGDAELTVADVDRWRASTGKPPIGDLTDEQRRQLAGFLKARESILNDIRALIPAGDDEEELDEPSGNEI